MCQAGISTADYKLAIHQLTELSKLLKNNTEQWARLAGASHEKLLSGHLEEAAVKVTEITTLLEAAFAAVHDHEHPHVHISNP
ncbi:MAG: hypothetical protein COW32_06290 [Candidatus Aquicultor secundus]|uniref:Uncharacterized protein n=1 Tax=Candidatus Aquicultor secundus TaxID=1973895 RepID=A0A2M7T5F9_9ACTN|nr:hypothetical protein [Candidatus Aquicultor secundus]NCO66760.1 hypothetical protein [Solirubrobacter sp.]OIO88646.1 MAG: hypothetical protein AUK32_01015 [Candidatus Aquicultor secundus]PIW22118.1 MAG: hypothetical protein COW32_06290 [Candidatus Aquicultor secundus]PIX53119.1 MAG: hypothetical protein COZ51_00500 [Candidatus Aquicultor secundus]PIY39716.1 MAG: hypothetical protein COZ03_05465 [Candidatus Aquicultor secundus]